MNTMDSNTLVNQTQKWYRNRNIRWRLLAIITVFSFLLLITYKSYLDYDVANYLTIGQMMVHGDIPFVNIIDINPPTIMYISYIPAWITSFTGVPLMDSALFFFFLFVIISGLLFIVCLKISQPDLSIPYASFWLTLWIILSILVYILKQFAQREHLIFLLLAGFVVLRKARHEGKPIPIGLAILSGFMVVLAITMKPQYVIPLLMVEVYYLVVSKNLFKALFVPEVYSILGSGLLYTTYLFIVPGMSDLITYWIPFLSRGYGFYNNAWSVILTQFFSLPITWGSLLITIILLVNLFITKKNGLLLESSFMLFGLGSLLVYFIQHKGWFYHSLPFHLSSLLGFVFLLDRRLKDYTKQASSSIINGLQFAVVVLNIAILASLYQPITTNRFLKYKETNLTKTIEALSAPQERIFFFSYDIKSTFPDITYTERISAGRFVTSFPIVFFQYNNNQKLVGDTWEKDEEKYYQSVREDFNKYTPNLVLVDEIDERIINYLKYRSFFNTELSNYSCVGLADTYLVFIRRSGVKPEEELNTIIQNLYKQHSLRTAKSCSLLRQ